MTNPVHETYGNRLRIRACGICTTDSGILLVNHKHLAKTDFWSPPGGGIEFGESASACVTREFKEETGLDVVTEDFLFACEFINPPLHGIELFFQVSIQQGTLSAGADPEVSHEKQIITAARFVSWEELKRMPAHARHGAFSLVGEVGKILDLRGYFKI